MIKTYEILDTNDLYFGKEGATPRMKLMSDGTVDIGKQKINFSKLTTVGTDVLDITQDIILITSGGVHAGSLADGTYIGQTIKLYMVATGGDFTLTPANLSDGSTLTFDAIGDSVDLIFDGTNWNITNLNGVAVA